MDTRVAIVTGANAGIGLSLVKRLLLETDLKVCMVCRNTEKAYRIIRDLTYEFPEKTVDLIVCDIANPQSVTGAAAEIKKKYNNISHIFCNAGVMSHPVVDWQYFLKTIFSRKGFEMLANGHGLLKQDNKINEKDGLSEIFSTNIFGHFMMLMELQESLGLGSLSETTQIIWTSSSNAKKSAFSLDDIQHKKGSEPYSSSKYAIDLISYQINQEWNSKSIYSHTLCPGLVITNLAHGIMSSWMWYLILPFLMVFRLLVPTFTLNPDIASYSLFWVATTDPLLLDPMTKYRTTSSVFGKPNVEQVKMDLDPEISKKIWLELKKMAEHYKSHERVDD